MKENLIQSAKRSPDREDSRPPLAPVYQALDAADDLARAVNNFLDLLYGAEPTTDGESVSSIPEGVIPRLAEHADGTRRRVGRTIDRLVYAAEELVR